MKEKISKIKNKRHFPIQKFIVFCALLSTTLFPQLVFAGCCEQLSGDSVACSDPSCIFSCFSVQNKASCDEFANNDKTKKVQWNSGKCWGLKECVGRVPTGCCIVKNGDYTTCYASPGSGGNTNACLAIKRSAGATDYDFSIDACNAEKNNALCNGHIEDTGSASEGDATIPGTSIKAPILTQPTLQITIPGLAPFTAPGGNYQQGYLIPWIGQYIAGVYQFLTGIVAAIAVTMIIYAGIKWTTAGGDSGKIATARTNISNAIIGLLLTFGTYLILYTLNPALVQFQALQIKGVKQIIIDRSMDSQLGGASIEEATSATEGISSGGPIPIFKQAGSPWGSKIYGNCPTEGLAPKDLPNYGNTACGPTSVAMITKFYGKDANPEIIGTWATKVGARTCGKGTGAGVYTQISSLYNDLQGEIIDASKAYTLLGSGKPIGFLTADYKSLGACYKSSGHFMVATSIDGDWVNINDPALCGMRGDKGTTDRIELNDKGAGYGIKRMKKDLFLKGGGFFYIHPK